MTSAQIKWVEPWRALQFAAEIPGVQRQLEREITPLHPLYGRGATVVGRRIDNDDVVFVLSDGTFANVHLVWGSGPGPGAFPHQDPSWFLYGPESQFVQAMHADAREYNDHEA